MTNNTQDSSLETVELLTNDAAWKLIETLRDKNKKQSELLAEIKAGVEYISKEANVSGNSRIENTAKNLLERMG